MRRSCVHVTSEKSPLLFADVCRLRREAQYSLERLKGAVGRQDLAPGGIGLGQLLPHAMALRGAVSAPLAFFGVRRASEVAALRIKDVQVEPDGSMLSLSVRQQKSDQYGVGQQSRMVAIPSWGGACPVQLAIGWQWFRSWMVKHRDYADRLSQLGNEGHLLVGLARARFGLGLASSGIAASWKKCFSGRLLSPRKGGARFYVVNGMPRETTQSLGGWRSPAVMENVYIRARSEEAAPEIRAAVDKARRGLEVELFVIDLDREVSAEATVALGDPEGDEARIWCQRFRSVRDLLVPSIVLPIRGDFWRLMGRRVRDLKLTTHQKREVLLWGSAFRADLRQYRETDPQAVCRSNKREAAVAAGPIKTSRTF